MKTKSISIKEDHRYFINILKDKDDDVAYTFTKQIIDQSKQSNKYYEYLLDVAELLNDSKSYVRTRAFMICCAQARWDIDNKLEEIFPLMMMLLHDDKPTVVRKCISALKEVFKYKPDLINRIKEELMNIDLGKYKESMISLIKKDIDELLIHEEKEK